MSPKRLSATGFADQRPLIRPTSPNQNISKNRRVDIVLKTKKAGDGATKFEPLPVDTGAAVNLDAKVGQGDALPVSDSIVGSIVGDLSAEGQ